MNILDMIDIVGEDTVKEILSGYSCPKNAEIENFIKKNAIDFAKKKMSITHIVMDDDGRLIAIITLAHKALNLEATSLSSTAKKRLSRYANLDPATGCYMVSAFLIAQFGKNYADADADPVDGNSIMDTALDILSSVQRDVGGGVVYLECEDKPQLLSFYQNENNNFRVYGERYSDVDNTKYKQLLRFF
ncbi:MAG: hypothetical protein IJA00_04090 [Bacteroidaceae bacterium]|nr:hypothetical protein [Bacteroidaceae bacterium]